MRNPAYNCHDRMKGRSLIPCYAGTGATEARDDGIKRRGEVVTSP